MDPNREDGNTNNNYFNIQVPDLMNDPDYIRELGNEKTYREDIYFTTDDFDENYCNHYMTKGIRELVENINSQDEYKYTNTSSASNMFQRYLTIMTTLKDLLLPKTDGSFHEKWILIARDFQQNCEYIFLRFVKPEYILTFLPMVPKQLEYTSMKLKEVQTMNQTEQENFKNLFSLIALGFIGKMKLLSFYISLTLDGERIKERNYINAQMNQINRGDKSTIYQNTCPESFNTSNMETLGYEAHYTTQSTFDIDQPFSDMSSNYTGEKAQSYKDKEREINTGNKYTGDINKYNIELAGTGSGQLEDIIGENREDDPDFVPKKRGSRRRGSGRRMRGRRKSLRLNN